MLALASQLVDVYTMEKGRTQTGHGDGGRCLLLMLLIWGGNRSFTTTKTVVDLVLLYGHLLNQNESGS